MLLKYRAKSLITVSAFIFCKIPHDPLNFSFTFIQHNPNLSDEAKQFILFCSSFLFKADLFWVVSAFGASGLLVDTITGPHLGLIKSPFPFGHVTNVVEDGKD